MPTPFMHLRMAERVRQHEALSDPLQQLLEAEWPAFYFGNVAPDFQVISTIGRETSHFYPIPPDEEDYGAFERMQAAHPKFADPAVLSRTEAVLTAAYGVHLLYDLVWDHTILTPRFRNNEWGTPIERFTAHNTLLAYADRDCLTQLPDSAESVLAAAGHEGWLPFDEENKLGEWQELLLAQLRPGGETRTIEIFAKRLRLSPEEFANNLNNAEWMAQQVFQHVPEPMLEEVLTAAVDQSVKMLGDYLRPLL